MIGDFREVLNFNGLFFKLNRFVLKLAVSPPQLGHGSMYRSRSVL